MSCISHAFASVHCCLVVTCWERADLSALFDDVYCIFCFFPMWNPGSSLVLDLSFPDLCLLSYFKITVKKILGIIICLVIFYILPENLPNVSFQLFIKIILQT